MNGDDNTLELIEEFLGSDDVEFEGHDSDLLDSDWDVENIFTD